MHPVLQVNAEAPVSETCARQCGLPRDQVQIQMGGPRPPPICICAIDPGISSAGTTPSRQGLVAPPHLRRSLLYWLNLNQYIPSYCIRRGSSHGGLVATDEDTRMSAHAQGAPVEVAST